MSCILKWILLLCLTQCLAEFEYDYEALDNFDPRAYKYNYIWRQKGPQKTTKKSPPKGTTKKPPAQKPKTKKTKKPTTTYIRNLDTTYFQALESYGVQVTPISEQKYPWIAKVVHSQHIKYPYMCTASCVERRIFITAGRCIVNLKLALTSVIYQNYQLPAKVFVLPSKPSKQMYDDIGIIVVENANYKGNWPTVKLFNGKRTDEQYKWFADLNYAKTPYQHKVIGYVTKKHLHKMKYPNMDFVLSELNIVIDIEAMCAGLMSRGVLKAFYVPCYHACSFKEFVNRANNCQKFLGTEGAAVLDIKTNTLLGVATWGTNSNIYELPVGFAIPNSNNYYKDIVCARTIRDDNKKSPSKGYHQSLCKT